VDTVRAVEGPVSRFITVSGTLTAEEQADVAAEVAGRIVATPVERGTVVAFGAPLVRIAATEIEAQAREAEANAAQIQARLGQPEGDGFDVDRVPEVASAGATRDLVQKEFERARMLFERKLVSQAEFDQRRAQAENARRQYEVARNGVEQQRQALTAAQARVTLARKALDDTVVRAPFAGVVGERLVSVGDYVTRGTTVVSVMRVNPLRVELTVPAQYIATIGAGQAVSLSVDGYPGETVTGRVRYIAPAGQAASRSLVVEAVEPNDKGMLRPGLFVSAQIAQASSSPAVLVPSAAVQTVAGTSRVFVAVADRVEARIVTLGQAVGPLVEATSGVAAGDVIVTGPLAELADGARIVVK
jgi:RND family efflux transporter MFP subunit